ncbi:hypothetical protein FACS1894198_1500 [Clostridia bacterium]|nr:hypothetical protein FACS1894198_1500 [Clostridia bacterium]
MVCLGACLTGGVSLTCSFGAAPTPLNVMPEHGVLVENKVIVCSDNTVPNVNITPFGMCSSLANPAVSAATTAAMGVLTPQPCTPMIAGTWLPFSATVLVGGKPVVGADATLTCSYAGVISVVAPGQLSVTMS